MNRVTRSEVGLGQQIASTYKHDYKREQVRKGWERRKKQERRTNRNTLLIVAAVVVVMYGTIYAQIHGGIL